MNQNLRKTYIDMAKGIGILLVIFGHAMTGENKIVSWQCTFFMPIFFICSGLCYTKPKSMCKNAGKILTPYYIGGGVGFSIEMCMFVAKDGMHITHIVQRLFHLLIGTSMWNYPLWFLVAFFVCKCVFDYIMKKSQGKKGYGAIQGVAAFVCFAVGLYLADIRKVYGFFYPFRADVGITMVVFMLIGFYTKKYCSQTEAMSFMKQLTFACTLLVINLISFHHNALVSVNSSYYGNPLVFLVGAVSGSYFIIFLCQIISRISTVERVLSWFGRNSLTIMCSHAVVLMFIAKMLLVANRFADVSVGLLDFVKFVCCVLAMIPICWLLEIKIATEGQ